MKNVKARPSVEINSNISLLCGRKLGWPAGELSGRRMERREGPNCVRSEGIQRFDELVSQVVGGGIDWDGRDLLPSLLTHLPKLTNWIQVTSEGKDPFAARSLLAHLQKPEPTFSKSDQIERLNQALRLAPVPTHQGPFSPMPVLLKNLSWVLPQSQSPDPDDNDSDCDTDERLLARIYLARARVFENEGAHELVILDTYRAIRAGRPSNLYTDLISLGRSYKGLGHNDQATEIFRAALSLLRSSTLNNETKSVETMRIVGEMRDIKIRDENQVLNEEEEQEPSLLSLYAGQNPCMPRASAALDLASSPERGRHFIANQDIPPGDLILRPVSILVEHICIYIYCESRVRRGTETHPDLHRRYIAWPSGQWSQPYLLPLTIHMA